MRTHRKYLPFLYLFLASLIPLSFYTVIIDPSLSVKAFGGNIGAPILFFLMVFLTLFALFTFIFADKRRGALASLYISGVLLLRYFGLKSLYLALIFLVIILLAEYLLSKRPTREPKKSE